MEVLHAIPDDTHDDPIRLSVLDDPAPAAGAAVDLLRLLRPGGHARSTDRLLRLFLCAALPKVDRAHGAEHGARPRGDQDQGDQA